jgi:hypothetical protein
VPASQEPPGAVAGSAAALPGLIDDKARRLAEFFNGEVVLLETPLSEPGDDDSAAA